MTIWLTFHRPVKTSKPQQAELIRQALIDLSPGWGGTDLGSALVFAADRLDALNDNDSSGIAAQIVLISDLQQGASLEALNRYAWPDQIPVEIETVSPVDGTNASLQLVTNDVGETGEIQVRVANESSSRSQQFRVSWHNSQGGVGQPVNFYVPPGNSRVLPVPRPADRQTDRLILTGDSTEFDNRFFVVPHVQADWVVGYLGSETADDVDGLQYYLANAFPEFPHRKVIVDDNWSAIQPTLSDRLSAPQLLVVSRSLASDEIRELESYLANGNTVLVVLTAAGMVQSCESLIGAVSAKDTVGDKQSRDYRMLGEIDFTHPLFNPLSGPKFNDFTKIRFWNHRSVSFKDEQAQQVIARFDNGDPAMWITDKGAGQVFVLAAGWNPDESELGLATKFVPLMNELLDLANRRPSVRNSFQVGDAVSLPLPHTSTARWIESPDGDQIPLALDEESFSQVDQPGIYVLHQDETDAKFAVNLNYDESRTDSMDVEKLAVHNVTLGSVPVEQEVIEQLRREGNVNLEARQKIWKWVIVGAIIVLLAETLLASRKQVASYAAGANA